MDGYFYAGLVASVRGFASVIAGILGVGGGIIQVLVMNLLMGVPLKVATGMSNYMIGVTATSAAFVRYARGDVHPLLGGAYGASGFLWRKAGSLAHASHAYQQAQVDLRVGGITHRRPHVTASTRYLQDAGALEAGKGLEKRWIGRY